MLDVRRLRLLRELKIRGTLAEVADALNYSPSSVSQQLTLLEKEAGVELLRKSGRRVQLTPQAEILVEHTASLLATLERAETDLASVPLHGDGHRPAGRLPIRRAGSHAGLPHHHEGRVSRRCASR